VCGITSLDEEAKKKGVLVVSGASSVPSVSGAVIDEFWSEFKELHTITFGITPGNKTDSG
jgi:hypothetical protein